MDLVGKFGSIIVDSDVCNRVFCSYYLDISTTISSLPANNFHKAMKFTFPSYTIDAFKGSVDIININNSNDNQTQRRKESIINSNHSGKDDDEQFIFVLATL